LLTSDFFEEPKDKTLLISEESEEVEYHSDPTYDSFIRLNKTVIVSTLNSKETI
jgi:hypothetical protein